MVYKRIRTSAIHNQSGCRGYSPAGSNGDSANLSYGASGLA